MNNEPFTNAAIYSFFILMLVLNGIWMIIKLEVWSNGRRGWLPSADVREFKLFASRQASPSKRLAYDILRYAWHICVVLLFVVPIVLLAFGYLAAHVH